MKIPFRMFNFFLTWFLFLLSIRGTLHPMIHDLLCYLLWGSHFFLVSLSHPAPSFLFKVFSHVFFVFHTLPIPTGYMLPYVTHFLKMLPLHLPLVCVQVITTSIILAKITSTVYSHRFAAMHSIPPSRFVNTVEEINLVYLLWWERWWW